MGSDDQAIAPTDTQLREDLADAMRESPRDSGKSIRFCNVTNLLLVVGLEWRTRKEMPRQRTV